MIQKVEHYTPTATLALKALQDLLHNKGWPSFETIPDSIKYSNLFKKEMGRDATVTEVLKYVGI
jgi:hypothetical protein